MLMVNFIRTVMVVVKDFFKFFLTDKCWWIGCKYEPSGKPFILKCVRCGDETSAR